MKRILITAFLILIWCFPGIGQDHAMPMELESPDGINRLEIHLSEGLSLDLYRDGSHLATLSGLQIELDDRTLGLNPVIQTRRMHSLDHHITPVVAEKFNQIREAYHELTLNFGEYGVKFRAYNEGIAYRFVTYIDEQITVRNEKLTIELDSSDSLYVSLEQRFRSNFERPFSNIPLSAFTADSLAYTPLLVSRSEGQFLLISDAALDDYPGMWFTGSENTASIEATFPVYPTDVTADSQSNSSDNYLAVTDGERSFPWRAFLTADHETDLITNQLIYLLGEPLQIEDSSWIEPGTVILDWWGRRNLSGVDFEGGNNTETALYFIDFAAEYGLDYVLLDDGWTVTRDNLLNVHPDLDIEQVMDYARERGVKIMLWTSWDSIDSQTTEALDQFEEWGVSGVKIDFMDRDDQYMVNFYERMARETAMREMVVMFHGAYKPDGLRRAYPNVLTREGLIEFEQSAVSYNDTPEHRTTLPFIRMVTGPMDYIPGTMNNVTRENFTPFLNRPMGIGTRAHFIALMVLFESSLQMIPDSPSDYYANEESIRFLSRIPVGWDESIVLGGKIGDYVAMARRNGENWYVGAISDENARTLTIDFSFLGDGEYTIEYVRDGPEAASNAVDYRREVRTITRSEILEIELAPGGGWVAILTR